MRKIHIIANVILCWSLIGLLMACSIPETTSVTVNSPIIEEETIDPDEEILMGKLSEIAGIYYDSQSSSYLEIFEDQTYVMFHMKDYGKTRQNELLGNDKDGTYMRNVKYEAYQLRIERTYDEDYLVHVDKNGNDAILRLVEGKLYGEEVATFTKINKYTPNDTEKKTTKTTNTATTYHYSDYYEKDKFSSGEEFADYWAEDFDEDDYEDYEEAWDEAYDYYYD